MTLVVHALWSSGRWLGVWAEDPDLPLLAPPRRGRPPRRPTPRPHPFAASVAALGQTLPHAGAADARELTLVLPSHRRGPQPSPTAGVDGEPVDHLAPWVVPALGFDAGTAIDVLLALSERRDHAWVGGDSVRHLSRVVELALELVARGRVLPTVAPAAGGGGHEARWRAVVAGADAERLRTLVAAMPPLLRSERTAPEGGAAVVGALVDAVVDVTVRGALGGRTLAPAPPRRSRRRRGGPPEPDPAPTVAERWLDALAGPDPAVDARPGEIDKLARALDEWRQSAELDTGPVRTCFRLVEPPEPDGEAPGPEATGPEEPWRLEFLLQAADDPSLLVGAADVWAPGPAQDMLAGRVADPQERLLEGLGRAVRLYPALDGALAEARPEALALDATGAAAFLRDAAPVLEQSGFGVLVPTWWGARRARLGARLKARTPTSPSSPGGAGGGLLGMQAIVDYEWEVALGDHSLTADELRELARLKQPLVRMRGQWVELGDDDLTAAADLLSASRGRTGRMTAADVLRATLGLGADAGADGAGFGLPVVDVEADGWLGDLLDGAGDRRLAPLATPDGFGATLRPYQERGLGWLAFLGGLGLGACLADDMGLGKTAQVLALLVAERTGPAVPADPAALPPTLVVCPMTLVGNWQREAARFAPGLTVHVHHGADRLAGETFAEAVAGADLVLTTYSLAARDRDLLAGAGWGRIVLDEAQNVKNSGARQTQAVRSLPAPQRIALTGTPVENRLSELWSIMQFLNPGLLGSEQGFRERFAVPVERYGDEGAAERLRRVTQPFLLRRLKTDRSIVADLPEKLEMRSYCNLTREQATLYQAVVDDMMARIEASEGIERRGLVLATMLRLKQVCNHPAQFLADGSRLDGRSGKLARLTELLDEVVAEGDRALVFTQFAEMGSLLQPYLRRHLGRDVLWLHGGTPKRERDAQVDRFQSGDPSGPAVFLLSIKAGGTGLTLTAANHVVHFDRWWNPAVEDQATDRAFRIGQHRNVQVRKLVCAGTLEERIDEMIERKRALAERIVGSGESWLTELSTDELRDVIALSADAVAEG